MIQAASFRFLLAAAFVAAALPGFAQQQAAAEPASAAGRLDTRLSSTPSRVVPVDRIVAVVNDDVITQNDLNERVGLVVRQLQRQGASCRRPTPSRARSSSA